MKVLVTGATGFVGGALARRLHKMNFNVTATGRNFKQGQQLQDEGITFTPADLADADAVQKICQGQDIVFHSGALASDWGKAKDFEQANVIGTHNIIAGCMIHNVNRLIHISTPSVYFTYRSRLNVKEDDPLPPPVNHYARTKQLAEQAVKQAYQEGLATITIRPRFIFGPGDRVIFPRIIKVLKVGRLPIIGDGKNIMDMTYIDNLVDALILTIDSPKNTLGRTYNITNGESVLLWELLAKLCERLGYAQPSTHVPIPIALSAAALLEVFHKIFLPDKKPLLTRYGVSVLANSYTLNIESARQELGYTPHISVAEGFERFIVWWETKQG